MPFQDNVYRIADELRAVASMGLHFAEEPHVEGRCEKVLASSARLIGLLEQRPWEEVLTQYERVRGRRGPILMSSAAVIRDDRLVLVRRSGQGLWGLPQNVVGASELMAEAARRGARDQAGVVGEVAGLMGVFDSRTWGYPAKAQFYQVVFRVEAESDQRLEPEEGGDVRLVSADEVSMLSPGVDPTIPTLFDLQQGDTTTPYFDAGGRESTPPPVETARAPQTRIPDYLTEMVDVSHELEEVGRNGVAHPEHPYAVERYRHMLSNSARLAEAVEEWSPDEVLVPYEDNIDLQGLGVGGAFAAAFLDDKILLIRREDTGLWAMPAGGADVGETWANCAQRELLEETAVGGQVVELLALFEFRVLREPPRPLIMAAFLVEPDPDAEPEAMPETLGAGYFPLDDLPEMSPGSTVHTAIDLYEGRHPRPRFDLPTG